MPIKCKVEIVGEAKTPTVRLAEMLEHCMQHNANEGWTLRSSTSRGGTVYLFFAKKEKVDG